MNTEPTVDPDYAGAVTQGSEGTLVDVWAVPGASKTEISGVHGGALKIRVAVPPEGGKANRAVARVLSAATGASVELISGRGSRRKRFLVKGVKPADLVRLISRQSD